MLHSHKYIGHCSGQSICVTHDNGAPLKKRKTLKSQSFPISHSFLQVCECSI